MTRPRAGRFASVSRRALHPPVRDPRFWIVQAMVVGLASAHLAIDMVSATPGAVPAGIPVALLLAPVSYAALRYGLAGSLATAVWATLLWLPDLLLSRDRGHVGNDVIELGLVIAVAVFVGYHIDAERLEHASADRARSEHRAAEARYRQLFDTNAAPILVADSSGNILDANPAARALDRGNVIGRPVRDILGADIGAPGERAARVIAVSVPGAGPRDYRVSFAQVPARPAAEPLTQLVLDDITEERAEGQRVHRFAGLLLKVQEEERKRIAQELHDEPLQLLVHLARSLERLGTMPEAPAALANALTGARHQTLDVASRLGAVMAGLRPPALEQLGLAAALQGFLADVGETANLHADMRIAGNQARLSSETELAAFRVAQEAVNNAIRHAGANQLQLTLTFSDGGLHLRVADNGRGFDPASFDRQLPSGRLGLLGMHERAALVGGQLTVQSTPGYGTVLTATFPDDEHEPVAYSRA
jgi:signal transduction histidine kinase